MEYVSDQIPPDFFPTKTVKKDILIETKSEKNNHLLSDYEREINPIFFLPMNDHDETEQDNDNDDEVTAPATMLLPMVQSTNQYEIGKRYEYYKRNLSEFPFDEFQNIITISVTDNNSYSGKTNEELLNDLLDTFGCEVFEFLNEIIQNRYATFDWSRSSDDAQKQSQLSSRRGPGNATAAATMSKGRNRAPAIASQVIVQSEEEKNFAKTLRKIEKKQKINNQQDGYNYSNDQQLV